MCERCDKAGRAAAKAAVEGWNRGVEAEGRPDRKVDFDQLTQNQIDCLGRYAMISLEATSGPGASQLYIAAVNGDLPQTVERLGKRLQAALHRQSQAGRN